MDDGQGSRTKSAHVCLCGKGGMLNISEDPVLDMLEALADRDVLTVVRRLSAEEARSPFPEGLYGLGFKRTEECIKILSKAGLVSSRRDGRDHVYYLNKNRFGELSRFIGGLV